MRLPFKITCIVIIMHFLLFLPVTALADRQPAEGYHDFQALTEALKQIAAQNPKITKLTSIGKTLQGRDIWLLQISGTKGPSPLEKQALLICGNLEGDHVIGSEVSLGIARHLVEGKGDVTVRLDCWKGGKHSRTVVLE